ncbi:sugar transferase [Bacillus salacetis]|uniref:sugar transferase n=1 Tax=Bacillus salacetis TaxID=2315464 RepID=UPI003BA2BD0C
MSELHETRAKQRNETLDINELLEEKKGQLLIKRAFDSVVSCIGLLVLSPLFIIISVIIKFDSKGPILFKQIRIGKGGKEFKIYKFRTMVTNAEKKGMQITVGKDSRITKVGHFLRKVKLDELPQLINVLFGDMSFVGPRPEVPRYVARYNKYQRNILKIRPGITDIASIEYRDENNILSKSNDPEREYINNIMPHKIELNVKYLDRLSVIYDLKIILSTIQIIMKDSINKVKDI